MSTMEGLPYGGDLQAAMRAQDRAAIRTIVASKKAEEEGGEAAQCRICFEGTNVGPLVAPCRCTGSIQFIHHQCLVMQQESVKKRMLARYEQRNEHPN